MASNAAGRYQNTITDVQEKYEGQVLNGKKDGFGKEENNANDTYYEGYFKEGVYNGQGIFYTNVNKCFFKGLWEMGQQVSGVEIFPNGDTYEGEYKNGKFDGKGCLHNNSIGIGKEGNIREGYRYEGTFQDNKRHGYGKEFYCSGSMYEGQFRNNLRHGKGTLTYVDGTVYQGDFLKGMPYGFGVQISSTRERIQTLKNLDHLRAGLPPPEEVMTAIVLEKQARTETVEADDLFEMQTQDHNIEEVSEEFYFEGEWVEGYKHGIGRLFQPDGSYYYCRWEFDRKVGEIIFYNAMKHQWKRYQYQTQPQTLFDHYVHPDMLKNDQIQTIEEKLGFPPDRIDGFQSQIDECGISGQKFEDNSFAPSQDSMGVSIEELKQFQGLEFIRLAQNDNIYQKDRCELFQNAIRPNQFIWTELADYQLMTCLEALTNYPAIFFQIMSAQYQLQTVGFFSLKLYIDGQWEEIIVDDFIPCYQSNRMPIFANTENNEIGWLIIQKAYAQVRRSFLGHIKNRTQYVEQILQMITGMPCQEIDHGESHSHNESMDLFWNQLQQPNSVKQMSGLRENVKIGESRSKVMISYLRQEQYDQKKIPSNYPYLIVGITQEMVISHHQSDFSNEVVQLDDKYLLIMSMNPVYLLNEMDEESMHFIMGNTKMNQLWQEKKATKSNYFVLGLNKFIQLFQQTYILEGINHLVQNSVRFNKEIQDFSESDHRFMLEFSVNLPTIAFINVEQVINEQNQLLQKEIFPIRIILCSEKDSFAKNKKELLQNKFVRGLHSDVENKKEQKMNPSRIQGGKTIKRAHMEESKVQASEHNFDNYEDDVSPPVISPIKARATTTLMRPNEDDGNNQDEDFTQQKDLKYKYIFGQGQNRVKNMFKSVAIEPGQYMLFIQVEGPTVKKEKSNSVWLNLSASIFSESLILVRKINQPENFLRLLYENLVLTAENQYAPEIEKAPDNFQRSDLSEREKGSNDLIIIQYFLTWEGSYLHYMQNKSDDKSWRQKLYFRTDNMKILDHGDEHKVDVHLMPQTESLIIIQQTGAQQYTLEGGQGICITAQLGAHTEEEEQIIDTQQKEQQYTFGQALKNIKQKREAEAQQKKLEQQAKNMVKQK